MSIKHRESNQLINHLLGIYQASVSPPAYPKSARHVLHISLPLDLPRNRTVISAHPEGS